MQSYFESSVAIVSDCKTIAKRSQVAFEAFPQRLLSDLEAI
jgi:hypothetical protein